MRIGARVCLLWFLLAVLVLPAAADKLQDSLNALSSNDTSIYEKAQDFLLKHGQQAEKPLRDMFHKSQDPLTRLRVVMLLGDIGDITAVDDLKQVLYSGNEDNAAVRAEIILSLAKLGSGNTLIDYLDSQKEQSPSVKAAIARGLQGSNDDKSKMALSRLLQSDNWRVFRAAAMSVSRMYELNRPQTEQPKPKAATGKPQLAEIVSGPTPGDEAILQALHAKQSSKDAQISQAAADLLSKLSQSHK
jgi:HEAT repeat protein